MADYAAGAIVKMKAENGDYKVFQVSADDLIPAPVSVVSVEGVNLDASKPVSFSFGPITIIGSLDTTNFGIAVKVSILDVSLGEFKGNVKDGLIFHVDILLAKGSIKLYLKDKEVRINIDLSAIDKHLQEEVKVFEI